MEINGVARHWELNPDIVENWAMPDYTDRHEYMLIEQSENTRNTESQENDLEPGEELWEGRRK
jgi:hypothetical protein